MFLAPRLHILKPLFLLRRRITYTGRWDAEMSSIFILFKENLAHVIVKFIVLMTWNIIIKEINMTTTNKYLSLNFKRVSFLQMGFLIREQRWLFWPVWWGAEFPAFAAGDCLFFSPPTPFRFRIFSTSHRRPSSFGFQVFDSFNATQVSHLRAYENLGHCEIHKHPVDAL